jgi:hypothetical protein
MFGKSEDHLVEGYCIMDDFSAICTVFSIANSAVGNDDFELRTRADMKEQHVSRFEIFYFVI